MAEPGMKSDGLLALQARRAGSRKQGGFKRTIPPSQNPTTLAPYKAPGSVADAATEPEATTVEAPAPAPGPSEERSLPASEATTEVQAQVRITVYVDDVHDLFMDEVRFAGARRRPRIDVSRSAVVRFALERLQGEMTPEQLYNAIAAKPVDPKAIGRKRR